LKNLSWEAFIEYPMLFNIELIIITNSSDLDLKDLDDKFDSTLNQKNEIIKFKLKNLMENKYELEDLKTLKQVYKSKKRDKFEKLVERLIFFQPSRHDHHHKNIGKTFSIDKIIEPANERYKIATESLKTLNIIKSNQILNKLKGMEEFIFKLIIALEKNLENYY